MEFVEKSTFDANEPDVMEPLLAVFISIDKVFADALPTTKSGFPSPLISPMPSPNAPVPAVKSCFAAKEPVVIVPDVLVFLSTEIV